MDNPPLTSRGHNVYPLQKKINTCGIIPGEAKGEYSEPVTVIAGISFRSEATDCRPEAQGWMICSGGSIVLHFTIYRDTAFLRRAQVSCRSKADLKPEGKTACRARLPLDGTFRPFGSMGYRPIHA